MYHTGALLALAIACGSGAKSESQPSDPPPPVKSTAPSNAPCRALPFAETVDLSEASGADVTPDGTHVVVVGDSWTRGAYVVASVETGEIVARGKLDLGDAGDDLEGLAFSNDRLFALSSSGFVYEYRGTARAGFELVRQPYAIAGPPWQCGKHRGNCGVNWEGLCLGDVNIEVGESRCRGFAASKRQGRLICVTLVGDKLGLDTQTAIDVSPQRTLSGCAISGKRIWASTNVLGANAILEVGTDGVVTPRLTMAPGSTEAIAVAGDVVIRFSDTADRPSLAGRYRCPDTE